MSFGATLSNALSGLTAATRSVEVISSNIANAATEGYARRDILLSSRAVGGQGAGVQVDGVRRIVNQAAIADRRLAEAALGQAGVRGDFLARLEAAVGLPGEPGSLSDRITALETALVDAASRPDQPSRLAALRDAAVGLAGQFNRISDDLRGLRMEADAGIARDVGQLNTSLSRIADLNADIRTLPPGARDASALIDERQRLIDQISAVVPLREIPREHGQVALYTPAGAALLDGTPSVIGFTATGFIDPAMTLAGGALSGLTLNGQPIAESGPNAPLGGGALAASFELRDVVAVDANTRLDALARDLIERFSAPGLDPTLPPGAPGLFTDTGAALNPANETGLAGRISFNSLADPSTGGDLRLLRDGLGSVAPGPVGDATLINGYADALATSRLPASGGFSVGGASGLAAEFLSAISTAGQTAEADRSFAAFKSQSFTSAILADGVDTDQEMQKLLLVEQAYAANARVLQTVDEMLGTLLGI